MAAENTRTVDDPSLSSVNQAIGELINTAHEAGNRSGSSVSFSQENKYSVNQAALKLGLSAGYMSVSVKASLSARRLESERTVTAYFVQKMFTATIEIPQRPTDFFSSKFTKDVLNEHIALGQISSDNLPVYVANIIYGRILMFSFTSTSNLKEIRAALSASFSSLAGVEIEGEYLDILNQAQISVVTIGGEGKNATALIQNGQLRDYFEEESALTSARPIAYTVRNLGDNSIARVSETTEYNITECNAKSPLGAIEIDVSPNDAAVNVKGPSDYNWSSSGDQSLIDLEPGGYIIRVSRAGYQRDSMEVNVFAGEVTEVVSVLQPPSPPIGAEYSISFKTIRSNNNGCTGEREADIYYEFRVNGLVGALKTESNSVPLKEGVTHTIGNNSKSVSLETGQQLIIDGWVRDDDFNASDLMAEWQIVYTYPNIPNGIYEYRKDSGGCSVVLGVEITKKVDIFPSPKAIWEVARRTIDDNITSLENW